MDDKKYRGLINCSYCAFIEFVIAAIISFWIALFFLL